MKSKIFVLLCSLISLSTICIGHGHAQPNISKPRIHILGQLYGGVILPHATSINDRWTNGFSYGLRVGLHYQWFQVSFDVVNYQFRVRQSYWVDFLNKKYSTSYTIQNCVYSPGGSSICWDQTIVDTPDEVKLVFGNKSYCWNFGINFFYTKHIPNATIHFGPGITYYTKSNKDIGFSVKNDQNTFIRTFNSTPLENHTGFHFKSGINVQLKPKQFFQLEVGFHDLFRNKNPYQFLSIQIGMFAYR